MTATIVEHDNRAPLDAGFAARLVDSMAESTGAPSVGIAGDANAWTVRPAGQLWERVAEGSTDYSANSTRRLAGRQAGLNGTTARWGHPAASGIIRAGERIK